MAKQPKQMSDDELVSICMEEIARGIGGGLDAENDNDISLPLDYYLGKLPGISAVAAKDKNASRYVSMDVMDGIEATVAEIMPTFSTDSIGFYVPSGEGDEESALKSTGMSVPVLHTRSMTTSIRQHYSKYLHRMHPCRRSR